MGWGGIEWDLMGWDGVRWDGVRWEWEWEWNGMVASWTCVSQIPAAVDGKRALPIAAAAGRMKK